MSDDLEQEQPWQRVSNIMGQTLSSRFIPLHRALRSLTTPLYAICTSFRQIWSAGIKWALTRSLQGFERLFLSSHNVRGSTGTAVGQSARGVRSVDAGPAQMSAGASTNIKEIVGIIDNALAGGMNESAWSNIFGGLEDVTQACRNGRPPLGLSEHAFSADEFRMVSLAAESAQAAYLSNSSELPDCLSELFRSVEQATTATRDGSVKASILVTTDYSDLPLLIVAFRGTASLVDWLVNLDGDLEDCSDFIGQRQGTSSFNVEPDIARTTAHAGLLRIAKCMASEVCNKILDAGSSRFTTTGGGRKPILMVTGHSAGGGVAALMSSHIRLRRHDIVDRFEAVHCVTFAAPPVFDSPDTVNDVPNLLLGLSINIVNYGDIVPWADKAYIKSLLALYIERAESLIDDILDFGEPIAWNYGQNVLLMDVAPIDADAQNADGDDGTDIKAFDVPPQIWKTLAFGSVKSHPMAEYMRGIKCLSR